MKPTVLITATNDAVRSDICDALARFDYEAVIASDETEALALLQDNRRIGVIVADIELGGLTLAREARAIRPHLGVVYTSVAPHRVAESTRVSGAPILRKPYAAQQLVGVIRGLGRRVLDDSLAA
jgi:DNA-binding response OmpR family regulator